MPEVSISQFQDLFQDIVEKYLRDTKQQELDNDVFYRQSNQPGSPPSLNDELNQNINVKALVDEYIKQPKLPHGLKITQKTDHEPYYKFAVKWLRETPSRKRKNYDQIDVRTFHSRLWPAYLGFNSLEAYLQHKQNISWQPFQVYYYSYYNRKIDFFQLKLNLDLRRGEMSSWIDDSDAVLVLKHLTTHQKNLILDFALPDSSLPFRLVFFLGEDDHMTQRKEYLGMLQGFDRINDPVSTYIIAIVDEGIELDVTEKHRNAKRLINLNRGYLKLNAVSPRGGIQKISEVPIRGVEINRLTHLADKKWLVWGIHQSNEVFQSTLFINDYMEGELHTAQGGDNEKQRAIIDVSQMNNMVILQTVPKGRERGVICQWKINQDLTWDGITTGVFTHAGIPNERRPYSGYLVMCELPSLLEEEDHPLSGYNADPNKSILLDAKFKEKLENFPSLKKLYQALKGAIQNDKKISEGRFHMPDFF